MRIVYSHHYTMTSLLTSFYLLNFKDTEIAHSVEVDCLQVPQKNVCTQSLYGKEKRNFFLSRTERPKKNWSWKRNAKAFDKLYRSYTYFFLSWEFNQPLKIFFSNGSIAVIEFNKENNALEKIEIYNNLVGKFILSRIVDAVIAKNCIYVTYCEPKLTRIDIDQESSFFRIFGIKKSFESKISHIDLIGPCNKSVERRLSLNLSKDKLLVWWIFNCDDVWPWTPVSYSADRVNMIVYSINDQFDLLCSIKTNGELIQASFSKQYSNQIFTLERVKSEPKDSINICVYEIIDDFCHHTFLTKLPLRGNFMSCDWSANEKLLISDSDHSLLIYDLKKKTTLVTSISFLPKQILWHPQNCFALVIGSNNQLQCFDVALTCIKFKMFYKSYTEQNLLNIDSFIPRCCSVQKAMWQSSQSSNSCIFSLDSDLSSFLILKFCSGIFSQNFGIMEFISQYLKSNLIDEAVLLLRSLNWCYESELSFHCLSKLTNYLFRKPFNSQNQAGLELALGTFYDNIDNLPKHVLRQYQHKLHHITRRFFHYLLRHQQLRKAFLLAVDLESQDLFLDIYNVAKLKGENILALVALHKAEEFDVSSASSSCSTSNSESKSVCSSDNESASDAYSDIKDFSYSNSYDQLNNRKYALPTAMQAHLPEDWLNYSSMKMNADTPVSTSKFPSCNSFSESLSSNFVHSSNITSKTFNEVKAHTTSTAESSPALSGISPSNSLEHHASHPPLQNLLKDSSSIFKLRESSIQKEMQTLNISQSNLKLHSTSSCRPLPEYLPHKSRNSHGTCLSSQTFNAFSKNMVDKGHHLKESNENVSLPKSEFCEEEIEELEDTKIKLVHFGII